MNGRTFKVTFFDKDLDVFAVETYHNVINQSALLELVENKIACYNLMNVVKAESEGKNYTQAFNYYLN